MHHFCGHGCKVGCKCCPKHVVPGALTWPFVLLGRGFEDTCASQEIRRCRTMTDSSCRAVIVFRRSPTCRSSHKMLQRYIVEGQAKIGQISLCKLFAASRAWLALIAAGQAVWCESDDPACAYSSGVMADWLSRSLAG